MTRTVLLITAMAVALTTAPAYAHGKDGPRGPRLTFSELDANGDGKVTVAEFEAHHQARFAKADADGNGSLSIEEMSAQADARKAEKRTKRIERMIERLDENGDNELSLAEMQAARSHRGGPSAEKLIERLDENGDGMLSEEEFSKIGGKFGKGKKRGGKPADE